MINKIINKTLIILFIILIIVYSIYLYKRGQYEISETFENKIENNDEYKDIYDKEFVDFYEITYRDFTDLNKDFDFIKEKTIPTNVQNDINILIAGCGVGKLVSLFKKKYKNVIGVDISRNMIQKSYELYPNIKFINGDLVNNSLFKEDEFTHIIFDYNCINYNTPKNMNIILKNCNKWLKTNGFLVVPIFDKQNMGISPRYYTTNYVDDKGVLHGYTYLNGFAHDGYMIYDDASGKDNVLQFDKFILEDNNYRIKKTNLYITEKEEMYDIVLKNNFQLETIAKDLKRKQDYYELAIFKKGKQKMNVDEIEKKFM